MAAAKHSQAFVWVRFMTADHAEAGTALTDVCHAKFADILGTGFFWGRNAHHRRGDFPLLRKRLPA
jgi:hypothetical protein